jgi:hypothetical protein
LYSLAFKFGVLEAIQITQAFCALFFQQHNSLETWFILAVSGFMNGVLARSHSSVRHFVFGGQNDDRVFRLVQHVVQNIHIGLSLARL